ncbi:MurR/RpiR family transcriptional regulator [Agrobacterium pusense]|uniref:MurR/RpiR family transcriptional regulator n=1 Tax=Agrobacterium pusense TaxID=648995 RepID=UPI001FE00930|nr:DNA-binding MurR/RpiR family transcriptional regulator [Rhizobium sp. SORGH_AS_0755]
MESKAKVQKPKTVLDLQGMLAVRSLALSFRQERVARFAVAYPEIVAFGTADSVAVCCSVTQSTVVRLAISLGFESYREFRRVFRQHVKAKATYR